MSEKLKITALFGTRRSLDMPLLNNSVLMAPSQTDWNDYGYRSRVDVRVRVDEMASAFSTIAYIGYLTNNPEEPNGVVPLEKLLESSSALTIPVEPIHHFFTMLPSMEAYREIVQAIGLQGAIAVLTAMNDLVVKRN